VLGPAGYGTFSLAFVAWFGVLAVIRSALMEPYTLAGASSEGDEWRTVTKNASGAVIMAGVAWGVIFTIAGYALGGNTDHGRVFLILAVLAPGLALQEFWRVAAFASSRARTAAANDAVWALAQVVAFVLVLSAHEVTAAHCLFAWGIGAWLAAGFGIFQLKVVPRCDRAAIAFARKWSRLGGWFTLTSATFAASTFAVATIVAVKLGNAALGLFRIVQTLFGPVQLLTTAAESVFVPHMVRVVNKERNNGLRLALQSSALMAGVVAGYGLVLLVASHLVLDEVFGKSFEGAGALVLPLLIAYTIDAGAFGAEVHLRSRGLGSRIAGSQAAASTTRIAAVFVLASVTGLRGAVWALVIASSVGAVILWSGVAQTIARERKSGVLDIRMPSNNPEPARPRRHLRASRAGSHRSAAE
jgi:O-antigen/teichoic acid export membrane protein